MNDTFKTISVPVSDLLWKDKNSKFIGYAFPVENEIQIKIHLEELRKLHPTANHICYAFQMGVEKRYYRANDDGEPNNSAGTPIYGQIQSFGVTNILIAVVRYFGGVKLGVSGLISAYRTTAQLSLNSAEIIELYLQTKFELHFEYTILNKVMRVLNEKKAVILSQKMEMNCHLTISIRKNESNILAEAFNSIYGLTWKTLD
jgi:uncharacterized YigZ family protein